MPCRVPPALRMPCFFVGKGVGIGLGLGVGFGVGVGYGGAPLGNGLGAGGGVGFGLGLGWGVGIVRRRVLLSLELSLTRASFPQGWGSKIVDTKQSFPSKPSSAGEAVSAALAALSNAPPHKDAQQPA